MNESQHFPSDSFLCRLYEENGLFARIIDAPAEEAVEHGLHLRDIPRHIEDIAAEALDELDWEETAMTAIKWARLFGGSIVVVLANDGPDLAAPLDWGRVQSVDGLVVYDCSQVKPDREPEPTAYQIFGQRGTFTVHASRCLVFKNDPLPEESKTVAQQFWGVPEYLRLRSALDDVERVQKCAVDLLDRSRVAVYQAKGISQVLATEQGEEAVRQRLAALDMCRNALGLVVLDAEENFSYKTANLNGVSDLVEISWQYLAAVSRIPVGILLGSIRAGSTATLENRGGSIEAEDKVSLEAWYSFVEDIQGSTLRGNLKHLLKIIYQAAKNRGELAEIPPLYVDFSSLWPLDELEKAETERRRAMAQLHRAKTAQSYVSMGALHPSEVRKSFLATSKNAQNPFDDHILDIP